MRHRLAMVLALAALLPAPAPARAESAQVYVATRGSGYFGDGTELVAPTVVVPRGLRLTLVNLHVWGHSITSDAWRTKDVRLFRSPVIPFGARARVAGVEPLPAGRYGFFCSNHIDMRGELRIVEPPRGEQK